MKTHMMLTEMTTRTSIFVFFAGLISYWMVCISLRINKVSIKLSED